MHVVVITKKNCDINGRFNVKNPRPEAPFVWLSLL